MTQQSKLDIRKYLFSQRTVNEWHTLSTDCMHAGSVNMFKNRIDKYLVRAGYTFNTIYCGLLMSQWLPCLLPSKAFLGWQSC